ncbi:transporter substrate-binding domain-containing protein [Vibrio profundum]|uniref:substrate-binding periplasmic protein n=1 Tax=Vibrio profundum TaxID=2910247 RepID=UPI003D0AE887
MCKLLICLLLYWPIVSNSQEIKIAYNNSWSPYSSGINDSDGILVALVEHIIETKLNTTVVNTGFPWKRAQLMVHNGSYDAYITAATEERLKFTYKSSEIVYQIKLKSFISGSSPIREQLLRLNTPEDLKPLRVCEILGNGWGENFYKTHNISYHTVKNLQACIGLAAKNRVDIFIHSESAAYYEISKMGLSGKIDTIPKVFGQMDFYLLLSKKSDFGKEFLAKFNDAVRTMKEDGSYQDLIEKLKLRYARF